MTRLSAVFALLLWAAPAFAYVDGGITQTFGSNNYRGTRAWADFGDVWHVKPFVSVYRSDLSNGTYKTFSGRVGHDTKVWGAGATVGGTPATEGYSNRFFGVDAAFSFTPGADRAVRRIPGSPEGKGPKGKGLARVDVGGAVMHTNHRDEFQAPATMTLDRRGQRRRATAATVGQTDVTANAGVSVLDTLLSVEYTVSSYSRDLNAISASPAAATRLPGLTSVIQGFPRNSFNAQVELGLLPIVAPYVSYTRTTFKLGAPSSSAVTFGATAGFEMLEAHGSLEIYDPGGGADKRTYLGFGVGLRL